MGKAPDDQPTDEEPMSTSSLEVVDFHGHWFPPTVVSPQPTGDLPPAVRET
jgi:hypothetical protein